MLHLHHSCKSGLNNHTIYFLIHHNLASQYSGTMVCEYKKRLLQLLKYRPFQKDIAPQTCQVDKLTDIITLLYNYNNFIIDYLLSKHISNYKM